MNNNYNNFIIIHAITISCCIFFVKHFIAVKFDIYFDERSEFFLAIE